MKSEKEVREHLKILKSVRAVIHPSVIMHVEYILGEGNEKDMKFILDTLKQVGKSLKEKNNQK